MMNKGLAAVGCILMLAGGRAETGQRPDLSGTWVATKDTPTSLPQAPAPVLGQQFALHHDGQTLTVTRRVRDTSVSATYSLDGTEVRSRIPGALCIGDSQSIETAAWEGDNIALTVVGSVPPGGGPVNKSSIKRVLRRETPDTLVVEASMRESAQAAPRIVGTVYRRTSDPMPGAPASQGSPKASATIAQLAWMSGIWEGPSGSDERWTPPAGGSMLGVSRTLRNGVMSAFEFLCVTERAGGLVYQAMPNGRSPATDFVLTKVEPGSATFENPAHDFPKMIRYTLAPDGTLEAVVSGDPKQRALTFTFKKSSRSDRLLLPRPPSKQHGADDGERRVRDGQRHEHTRGAEIRPRG